jgi:hypothetical protein
MTAEILVLGVFLFSEISVSSVVEISRLINAPARNGILCALAAWREMFVNLISV